MIRSSDFFILCPNCQTELRVRRSGNGLPEWSDGFFGMEGCRFCSLASCPSCGHPFWIDDADRLAKVGEPTNRDMAQTAAILAAAGWATGAPVPLGENSLPAHNATFALPATSRQLISLLEGGLSDKEREHYLRKVLWRRGNHSQRGIAIDTADAITDSFKVENLRWLLSTYESLPSDDRDVVIEAELLRELGLFSESIKRIEMAYLSGSARAIAIHAKAVEQNAKVCVVREDGLPLIF